MQWRVEFANNASFPLARFGITFFLPSEIILLGGIKAVPCSKKPEEYLSSLHYLLSTWNYFSASGTWLPGQKQKNYDLTLTFNRRGSYVIPPPDYYASDPAGLFRGTANVDKKQTIMVYPRIESNKLLSKSLFIEEIVRQKGPGLEDRYEFHGVRDYQLNDSLKSINWYASARTGELKSNLFQPKINERCLIVLDVSVKGHPEYENPGSRDYEQGLENIISAAASTAASSLDKNIYTAFLTNAPTLIWEEKPYPSEGEAGFCLKRKRGLSKISYGTGDQQARLILSALAIIDETSRARVSEQEQLWLQVLNYASNAVVHIFCYHEPPSRWKGLKEDLHEQYNNSPEDFYSKRKLSELGAERVRLITLKDRG